jgi:hypothetical protein
MKRMVWIGIVFFLVVAACARPDDDLVETRFIASPTNIVSPELSAIDSLMWRQPDSALACLIPYFDTCCRDVACNVYPENHNGNSEDVARYVSTNVAFNRHYAHLLLAELLYKNDYAQTNRPALQQAVAYFDSLTLTLNDTPAPKHLIAGTDPLSLTRNDNLAFLTARAHYINGVGYYERDSIVPACAEYLKALELMESRFDEKDLVGKKARFMTYTYNRLGEMFSEQYMMEPALNCYRHSYDYSVISPISSYTVSNSLYHIGKQYDKKGDKDSADYYYSQALLSIPDSINLYYRDIVSSKALLSYQMTHQAEMSLERLKQMAVLAADDDERLTRYLLIGSIYFEERQFDSARLFLEPVFLNMDDAISQIQAAEYLRILYDSLEEKEKSDYYVHFLAANKPMEYESDAKISNLSELYKSYLEKKLKQRSEKEKQEERRQATKKTIVVIIPILILIVFILILLIRNKHRKNILAKEEFHQQQLQAKEANARIKMEERDKQHMEAIEAERQAHRMEQAAILGRLKRKNEEVRELRDQIKRQEKLEATPKHAESFVDEPICQLILERVNEGLFKAQMDCRIYKDYALDKDQLTALRNAANRHYNQFTKRICEAHPELTRGDIDYCCLYLLDLTDADVAALMQRAYNTVNERNSKLRRIFNSEKAIGVTLQAIAEG